MGILLALDLASHLPLHTKRLYIHLDNQAAIAACCSHPRRNAGQYILLAIHKARGAFAKSHPHSSVHLRWIPGHCGVPGNEAADEEARAATEDPLSDSPPIPLTHSAAAARQHARIHFTTPDENLKVASHHRRYRGDLTSRKTSLLLGTLSRAHCSLLVQLRSGHIALRGYLARFAQAEGPHCPACRVPETVPHFLLECRRYTRQRAHLVRSVYALDARDVRTKATDLTTLLSHPDVIPITLHYVDSTRRFPLYLPRHERLAT